MIVRMSSLMICLLTLQAAPQPMRWVPPDPTNLKVFPKAIPKADLVAAMKGFAMSLGVRCEFCHVGEGNDLSKFDFASDEKRQKRNARVMLQMVANLNQKLGDIPEPRVDGTPAVTCYTCHRGEKKPLTAKPPAIPQGRENDRARRFQDSLNPRSEPVIASRRPVRPACLSLLPVPVACP